ncbi:DUF58 domain-containing protein [Exiguobacterium algae]|uniref:DUF58 domain-containing protein n=1 Tax=Exiguobacterium algae TaxID=2751250 RepID=UPI001BEA04AF|nr:DUF58 domain-containing protein [Exiguobacterium algae]
MIFSTHNVFQWKWMPAYTFAGVVLVFVPFLEVFGYLLCLQAGVVWLLEHTRRQLERQLHLQVHTHESLLFVKDETEIYIVLEGSEYLEKLGLPVRIRLKSNTALSFIEHEQSPNSLDLTLRTEQPRHTIRVQAEFRGPAYIEECVLAVGLPFHLGTYLLECPINQRWTVLPSLKLHPPVGTKRLALGERPMTASPLRNPLQILGSKSYEGEPVKEIDWVATAKLGRVQSKVFQKTSLDTFTFAVDLSGPSGYTLHHDFESIISQVAYVTSRLLKEECKIELFINRFNGKGRMEHISLQEGERGTRVILMMLADLHPGNRFISTDAFVRMVERKRLKQSHLVWFNQHNLYD